MKLRIQDGSVRYRITLKELEDLKEKGELVRETRIPSADGTAVFRYKVRRDAAAEQSRLDLDPFGFTLILSEEDFAELAAPENEGAYIRREWPDETGRPQRCLVFIEKDRPATTCIKQEAWIYEIDYDARSVETRPIPERTSSQ